jgi:GMP synthase-like glutamine amidotransferase
MICFVSLEHESWLQNPENRTAHFSYCMDVKLGIEALLISGNATGWPYYDRGHLAELFDIIRTAAWPILGLCGGHQLIAMAYGADVAPMRRLRPDEPEITTLSGPGFLKEWGFMRVHVTEPDPLFDELGPSPVFLEVHYCEVKELPPGFQILASSRDCPIQVMKQLDRPVYGTQFHPEAYTEGPHDWRSPLVNLVYPDGYPEARPDGRGLLANFFRIAGIL